MKTGRQNVSRLEEALKNVYRAEGARTTAGEFPDLKWEQETMRRIRAVGPLGRGQNFFYFFETLVWRLAPVAGVLIIAMGVWMLQLDLTTEIETAALMDPIGFDFINKLGIL